MKLGIIGEPCIDFIHRAGKVAERQLGGILYSVTSLAVITGKEDRVYPVFNLGEDEYENVTGFLKKHKNIQHNYIFKCKHKTRIVNLYYNAGNDIPACLTAGASAQAGGGNNNKHTYDREENSTEPTLPLEYSQLEPVLNKIDGLLINMVSGIDITLDTLKLIRENFKGYIHMDLHNIVMKTADDGTRSRMPIDNWLQWCTNCDTLQMNEAEINVLGGTGLSEYETAEKVLETKKVKSVIVTRGKLGVSMFIPKNTNAAGESYFELDRIDLPSNEARHFKDSTGCGDVLGSAFFYKSLYSHHAVQHDSLNYANKLACRNAELNGVEEMEKLIG